MSKKVKAVGDKPAQKGSSSKMIKYILFGIGILIVGIKVIVPLISKASEYIDLKNKITILLHGIPRIQDISWSDIKFAIPVRFVNTSSIDVTIQNLTCVLSLADAAGVSYSDIGSENLGTFTLPANITTDKEFYIKASLVSGTLAIIGGASRKVRAKFNYSVMNIPQDYALEFTISK